jgi:hypothetical protein
VTIPAQVLAADGDTLTQVLPPIATVVAAILGALITGFGAASLKHRWDAEADNIRWQRERTARIRAQRLSAFAEYLTARPDLNAVQALADKTGDATVVVSAARLAAAKLLILLPDANQRATVENDLRAVESWVASWLVPSRAGRSDVPSSDLVLGLARQLATEPDAGPGFTR